MFVFGTQACKPATDPNQDNPQVKRFIRPVNEEIQDLATEVAKNHYKRNNFQDVASQIVEQLEWKHHRDGYDWSCVVGFQFAISKNGAKYSIFLQEPSTKLYIFCSLY